MYRFGTLGLGTTLYVFMILSGYSSLIFDTRRVPMPGMVRLVFDMCQQISVHLKIAETAYGRFQEPKSRNSKRNFSKKVDTLEGNTRDRFCDRDF